jgi:hypothetical protein
VAEDFTGSAAALREELKKLERELRRADQAGDRRAALNALERMLVLQKDFMARWPAPRRPPDAGDGNVTDPRPGRDSE